VWDCASVKRSELVWVYRRAAEWDSVSAAGKASVKVSVWESVWVGSWEPVSVPVSLEMWDVVWPCWDKEVELLDKESHTAAVVVGTHTDRDKRASVVDTDRDKVVVRRIRSHHHDHLTSYFHLPCCC